MEIFIGVSSIILGVIGLALTWVLAGKGNRAEFFEAIMFWSQKEPQIAIAVVKKEPDLIALVHRKPNKGQPLFWQFPSRALTPGLDIEAALTSEIKDEIDLDAKMIKKLGQRHHPKTGALCVYYGYVYEAGTIQNADPEENIYARWVSKDELINYMPKMIYKKALLYAQGADNE